MALIRRNVENGNNQVRTTDRPQILFRMNLSFVEVEYFYIRLARGKIGTTEWTRTTDPYHVKVVL